MRRRRKRGGVMTSVLHCLAGIAPERCRLPGAESEASIGQLLSQSGTPTPPPASHDNWWLVRRLPCL
jgi:hypothetical protein